MNLLEEYCLMKRYRHLRLDGNTKGDDRGALLAQSNPDAGPHPDPNPDPDPNPNPNPTPNPNPNQASYWRSSTRPTRPTSSSCYRRAQEPEP